MSVAGIVSYEIGADGNLKGQWTHADLRGRTAAETATRTGHGRLDSDYAVEIYLPDGTRLFEGALVIRREGEVFVLTWTGHRLVESRVLETYTGMGLLIHAGLLVATFERADE